MIVHMIGNAHLDPVWLWPWQEGVDEALATFRSAADRCDEYPEFIYTRGESWLYEQVERLDPELFERVRRLVEDGRWHVSGGQYIQPDANLPTLDGWRRQLEHGCRYFEERFGLRPRIGYNVDTFGHPATLPDILAAYDYEGYLFHRPNAHQVELPAQTFRWRGVGGGEVVGFRIAPCYVTRTDDLYGQIMLAIENTDPALGHAMCFYGVGNHGGGPTKGNIEYILENQDFTPGVELKFSHPQAFFDAIADKRESLPLVTHELQRTFPGCYSVMHDIKQEQHRGENALSQCAAVIETFGADENQKAALHRRLDTAWNDLLFTQFHDILAGTSVPSAWSGVRAMQGRARISGEEIVVEATRRWARSVLPPVNRQQLVLLNPDDASWQGLLEAEPFLDFDAWGERWLSDLDGNPIPFQTIQPEGCIFLANRVIFPTDIPANGYRQILVRDDAPPETAPIETDLEVTAQRMSNRHLSVELAAGGIAGLSLNGQQLLGERGIGLHLRHDSTDTWTFQFDRFSEPVEEVFAGGEWVVEESGPLRARVRLEGHLGHSRVRWTLGLHRDEPRLHMTLEINWNERYKLLQMPVHLAQAPPGWTDGLAGGAVERQPGGIEWPLHGWSRVPVGETHLALTTPDAYSLSVDGDIWQWSLLRAPRMAWGGEPDVYAGHDHFTDQGTHTFEWILHAGASLEAEVLTTAARHMARAPIVFDRYEGMDRPPWKNAPARRLWTGPELRALQDGRMKHLEEVKDGGQLGLDEVPVDEAPLTAQGDDPASR